MDTNGWLLVLVNACGCQWIAIGTYRGPLMPMDGYWCLWIAMDVHCCLWRPMDTNGWLLVLVDTNGYALLLMEAYGY